MLRKKLPLLSQCKIGNQRENIILGFTKVKTADLFF